MLFFFFSFTATSVCSTLSLHDALPICWLWRCGRLRRLSWFLNALRFRRWARLGLGLRFRLGFGLLLRLIAVFTLRGVWSFARRSLWLWFGCLRCRLGFHRCSLHGLSVYRLCSYRLRIFRSRFFWTRLDFFGWRFAGVLPSRLDWQWTLCGLRWLAR